MSQQYEIRRKPSNLLILPGFQFKLLGYFVALFLLTSASLYSASYLFFHRLNQKALSVGIPEGHVFFKFIANQKHDLDMLFIGLAIVNLILLIATVIVLSHRIAGPFLKLKKHLHSIHRESDNFKLRESDFFQDLEGTVDSLRDKLK